MFVPSFCLQLSRRVQSLLGLAGCVELRMGADRPNLFLEVRQKGEGSVRLMARLLRSPPLAGKCGLIYCLSTKDCEKLAEKLREAGVDARAYHAKMRHCQRNQASLALRRRGDRSSAFRLIAALLFSSLLLKTVPVAVAISAAAGVVVGRRPRLGWREGCASSSAPWPLDSA